MIKRITKHTLKFSTTFKKNQLDRLFKDYKKQLIYYIKLILDKKLPLKLYLSSKLLPDYIFSHTHWKQMIYKHASEIIRSNIEKIRNQTYKKYKKVYKYFKKQNRQLSFLNKRYKELNINYLFRIKIQIKALTIIIDSRKKDSKQTNTFFNEFVRIGLPYFQNNKKRCIQVKLPIKYHKHSLKYKDWKRASSITLGKYANNDYYLGFIYEKEKAIIRKTGKDVGIDIGYKKLLSCSNQKIYGKHMEEIYKKLAKKLRGSHLYQKLLTYKQNEINRIINIFFKENDIKNLVVEDLKNVKYKSKFSKKINNKLQYWTYKDVLDKVNRFCEESGTLLHKINPAYTSQTCPVCGAINKRNRNGEVFKCISCRHQDDADLNASINILNRFHQQFIVAGRT